MIGVATPGTPRGFSDPFYLEFLGGLGDGAMRAGYNLVIAAPTASDPEEGAGVGGQIMAGARGMDLEGLVAHGAVDAVALTEPAVDDPRLGVLRRYSVPFAFLGTCEEGDDVAADVSFVDGDNVGGSREAVEHLITLGHRRIACLAGAAGLVATRHRLEGYRRAMQEAGLTVDGGWVVDGGGTKQGGRRAMERLLVAGLGRGGPTAVFACNDVMAVGALLAAREAGLSVPGDVSIVGFDGIPLSELVEPALTTVQQPIYDLGRSLAVVLLGQLDEPRAEPRVERKVIPCHLVVRASTGPPTSC